MNNTNPVFDVSKVANRKRMGDDVEKLREKVSRETSKIIKLKVAQDTAYWDLKEKLQAVEANHERLQSNMVDVQMQHEAISTSYQTELRRRPETLNKLAASRAIADTLEENTARLRDSLRRQAADCAALQNAYAGAAQRAVLAVAGAQGAVRAQRASFEGAVERERAAVERARAEALCAAAAAASYCQQAESARHEATANTERAAAATNEVNQLREKLQAVQRDLDRTTARYTILAEENDRLKSCESNSVQLLRKAEIERERLIAELHSTRDLRERDNVEMKTLRAEVARLEAEFKTECARRDAELEEERSAHARAESEWRAVADRTEAEWGRERDTLAAEVRAARDTLAQLQADTDAERVRLEAALTTAEERGAVLLAELEEERARGRAAAASLTARAETISDLMRDVNREAEARARAEESLKTRDATLRKKEAELVDCLKIINDVRAEKDRLQEKIQAMQATIDNIQTELTRDVQPTNTRPATVREPAERDGGGTEALMDFSFLMSDSSGDSMSLEAGELKRRVHDAAGGGRRAPQFRPERRSSAANNSGSANRPSVVNSTNPSNRYFFKNKRLGAKKK